MSGLALSVTPSAVTELRGSGQVGRKKREENASGRLVQLYKYFFMAVYRGLYRGRPGCAAYKVLKLAVLYAYRTLPYTVLYFMAPKSGRRPLRPLSGRWQGIKLVPVRESQHVHTHVEHTTRHSEIHD